METVETLLKIASLSRFQDNVAVSIEEKCDGDSGDSNLICLHCLH
jgi:hypothetical protein